MREAAWGRAAWAEACRRLVEALPGSAASIANYDLGEGTVNAVFEHGLDPGFVASYRDHYAAVNPWIDYWSNTPEGHVSVSERDSPSRAFRDSEFYVDWLAPQGNMEAAVGMRLDIDRHNTVHVAWHYDLARAPAYDGQAAAILEGLKPAILAAVRNAALLRDGLEGGLRLGAMIERIDGAALLVDRDRRIREANAEAAALLRRGDVLTGAADVLAMRDPAAQRWLEETVTRLVDAEPVGDTVAAFGSGDQVFRMSVTPAPDHAESDFALLVRPRPQALVVVSPLVGGPTRIDAAGLSFAFGLSAAEIRLCQALVNGRSLAEAAQLLGLSDGTVRQRVKMIFNKTRTHRQGELVALLGRFRLPGTIA